MEGGCAEADQENDDAERVAQGPASDPGRDPVPALVLDGNDPSRPAAPVEPVTQEPQDGREHQERTRGGQNHDSDPSERD
jgi:cell division septation protein DedD